MLLTCELRSLINFGKVNYTLYSHVHTHVVIYIVPLTDTTDVQTVQAVFFQNRLFLQCSFADNSQARGCVFTLVLIGSNNETERFEVRRQGNAGSLCTTANNQREVYSSVLVMDWEENGEDGSVTLNVTNVVMNVSTLAEYTSLTGCVEGTHVCTRIAIE